MQQIHIIRHGQSVANQQRIIAGQHESPLSDLGVEQAHAAAASARHFEFDTIVSSPMSRARQTAEIIATHNGIALDEIIFMPELKERHLGELEGKSYDSTPFGSGNVEDAEGAKDIEPIDHLYKRAEVALEKIYELPGRHILVVCHNGVGRMLRTIASGGKPLEIYDQPRMENAVIYPLSDI